MEGVDERDIRISQEGFDHICEYVASKQNHLIHDAITNVATVIGSELGAKAQPHVMKCMEFISSDYESLITPEDIKANPNIVNGSNILAGLINCDNPADILQVYSDAVSELSTNPEGMAVVQYSMTRLLAILTDSAYRESIINGNMEALKYEQLLAGILEALPEDVDFDSDQAAEMIKAFMASLGLELE